MLPSLAQAAAAAAGAVRGRAVASGLLRSQANRAAASVSGGARDAAATAAEAPSTSTFSALPLIDVRPLLDPSASRTSFASAASALHAAARDVGFFYATGVDGVLGDVPGLLGSAAEWFTRPDAEKAAVALSPSTHFRGWQPLGANVTRYGSGADFVRDAHEALDLYFEPGPGAGLRPSPLHGPNPWPAGAPAFVDGLRSHIASCLRMGQAITRGMAAGLGLPPAYFEGPGGGGTTAETSYWVLRVLSSPPLPASARAAIEAAKRGNSGGAIPPDVGLSCGAHCDYGMLTFVAADAPGLEVRNAAGAWVGAPPVPGAVVVNTGDMWRLWSAGQYAPTLHRVVYRGEARPRTSVAFFYEPAFGCVCRPPPQLPGAADLAGKEVEYGAHLEGKVLSNFEL